MVMDNQLIPERVSIESRVYAQIVHSFSIKLDFVANVVSKKCPLVRDVIYHLQKRIISDHPEMPFGIDILTHCTIEGRQSI